MMHRMYTVTNPKTGKTYTYGATRRADAYALAKRLGVEVQVVTKTYSKTCVCGRPEDTHESYDCIRDYNLTGGW